MTEIVHRLRTEVIDELKRRFVGRDEVIDLIALAVVAGEHLYLLGPPGTAKSALIRQFASALQGRFFEYLLTRFSEPNELFGPIDLVKLREGTVATVTTGMLPEAEFAFLDEIFNANSAILNHLLEVLNERVFRRGAERHKLPLLSMFSASNHLPEDEALKALFDRFLLRCHVDQLPRELMPQLLAAGWALERPAPLLASITSDELRELSNQVHQVELKNITERYNDLVFRIRDLGVALTDRRAVKVQKLLAGSALLCGRMAVNGSDFWVLRYVWDREEQIAPLAALVNGVLKEQPEVREKDAHPLSAIPERVDGEELARQLETLEKELSASSRSLAALARLREQAAEIADRSAWVADVNARKHLLERANKLLQKIGT
ncbi:MAG TPA: AAA family ATPase [Gemmataceae bacterium]|nr:AAA family ATPase [Gemmataceae bacterium]